MSVEIASATARPPRRTLEYRPSLDGLRGAAVAGVVAFHLGHLRGGFLGVDLFFTLSGYLITRLLLLEHESTGRISLGAFWSRRAWRLLPAMYLLLAALALYAALVARPDELDGIRGPGLASLAFVANWWFISSGDGYWDLFTAPSPLEHVWSLAIEQQFYVVWPVVLAVLLGAWRLTAGRRGDRRLPARPPTAPSNAGGPHTARLLAVTLAGVAVSTMALAVLAGDDVSRAYFGSGARAASILVGAVLAIVVHRGDPWVGAVARSPAGGWVGVAAALVLAWSWVTVDGAVDLGWYRGGFLLHATAVAAIIALLIHRPTGVVTRLLSIGPLRGLGIVSYGLYLWHWPVIVVLDGERTGLGGVSLLVTRLIVAMALTLASYALVERPARRRLAARVSAPLVFTVGAAAIASALFVATVPPAVDPVIGRAPGGSFAAADTPTATAATTGAIDGTDAVDPETGQASGSASTPDAATDATSASPDESSGAASDAGDAGDDGGLEPAPSALLHTAPRTVPTVRTPTAADPLRVLLVGDSYMYDAFPGIAAALSATGLVTPFDGAGFGLALSRDGWEQRLTELVEAHRPELVVAMWAAFDVEWLRTHDADDYVTRLDQAVDLLTADGAALAFVGFAPSLSAGVDRVTLDRSINELFAAIPERHPGRAVYVDPDPIVAPNHEPERWIDTADGPLLVRKIDVSHFCGDGAARFGLAIGELVQRSAGVAPADPSQWWAAQWRHDARYDVPSGACA